MPWSTPPARCSSARASCMPVLLVGAPLRHAGRVYNTALVMHRGRLLGVVPKIHLPNYREFYERAAVGVRQRHARARSPSPGQTAPFGSDLLFEAEDVPGFVAHVEICEDVWVPIPPSAEGALAGATVLANLSASPITIGKAETRRMLCQSQSARCLAAYLYSAAGAGESTTDLAWDGQAAIFENGVALAEGGRFGEGEQIAVADVDLDLLRQERMRMGTFDDNRRRRGVARFPPRALPAGAAGCRSRPAPARRALPLRAGRPGAARAGLLRGLQHPGGRPRAAPARRPASSMR